MFSSAAAMIDRGEDFVMSNYVFKYERIYGENVHDIMRVFQENKSRTMKLSREREISFEGNA